MNRTEATGRGLSLRGVEKSTLLELAQTVSGLGGKTKSDFTGGNGRYVSYKNAYANPAVDQTASDFVVIGASERQNQLHAGDVVITGSSENLADVGMSSVVLAEPDEPLYLNSFCFALRFKNPAALLPKFSMYLFRAEPTRSQIRRAAIGVTRINISKSQFMAIEIPVPPLEVQREIVRILDTLGSLQGQLQIELSAELKARRAQHAYYRDSLLTFQSDVPRRSLSEIAQIGTGSRNTNEAVVGGKYPFFVRSQEPRAIDEYEFDEKAIITAGDGVGVGKVFHYIEGKYALHQRAYRIRVNSNLVNPKFLFHFIRNDFLQYLATTSVHASVTSLRRPMFEKYPVPVPSLGEQEKVVETLDKLEGLADEMGATLQTEMADRRKQYEYHRDSILSTDEERA